MGKRHLENAVKQSGANITVNWLPFQLNASASKAGVNKVQMYMQKFGRTKEQVLAMSNSMRANFEAVGLPYSFSDESLTGNTFNSHRLIALAGSKGPEVQDKVVEALFQAYFADDKFLNDPEVLVAAAVKGGCLDESGARAFVTDEDQMASQVHEELETGKGMNVQGVPFFVLSNEAGQKVTLSGAQPAEQFVAAFGKLY